MTSAVAFAACGGNNGNNGGNGGATPPAQRTPSGGGDAGSPEPRATEGTATDAAGGDSGELRGVAAKFAQATFRATYQVSGDLSGLTNAEITIYKDGADRIRFDFAGEQDGQAYQASFIESAADSYLCISGEAAASFGELLGTDTSAGVCLKSAPDDPNNPVGSILDELQSFSADTVELQSKEEMQIAGQDATCYTVRDTETSTTNTACFNGDGVLLAAGPSGAMDLNATSVSAEVSASDFEPPYPVQDLPSLGE
jgi:hypothetical protein